MAAKILEFHPAALAEFKEELTWYLERSETAAVNFVAELDRAVDLVTKSPRRWPVGEHATRKFVLHRFPFAVIYREKKVSIQVLAIAHGRRRPGYWKRRH
jgi:toxin ParE1/3/4